MAAIGRVAAIAWAALALGACSGKTGTPPSTPDTTQRSTQIAELEARADRVKDSNDIKRLQRALGYYFDQGHWDHIADLFTEDGTYDAANEGVHVGQARIREYLKKSGGDRNGLAEGEMHNWMMLQPVISVASDGMSAKGRWRGLLMLGQYGKSAAWGEGTFENEYVKDRGVWKIRSLRWFPNFVAPYEGGWAKAALPSATVPAPYHYQGGGVTQPPLPELAGDLLPYGLELSRIEAHDAVENLQAIYGYFFDRNDWDSAAELFTEDATYEVGQRGVYQGRKRIREALSLIGPAGGAPGRLNHELQLQPVIHVSADGQSAKARWRTLEMKGEHGKSGMWGSGIYENEYRLDGGRWKISKLHYYVTFRADYDKGWLKAPIPMEPASKDLPPDAPPTEIYGSLPEVHLAPYHFANPGLARSAPALSGAASASDVRSLATKIARLNDDIEVQRLQRIYGYYVDKNMWSEVSELFADDATLEIGGRGVFAGKKRINEYLHYLGKEGPQRGALYDHSQWQIVTHVEEDGTRAKQRLRALIMAGIPNAAEAGLESSVFGECTYENEYVKVDGVWKISKLYSYFNMYTPYADGWAKKAVPNTKPEQRLPPDRPPTRTYETYPAPIRLEYHYPNPVTGKR